MERRRPASSYASKGNSPPPLGIAWRAKILLTLGLGPGKSQSLLQSAPEGQKQKLSSLGEAISDYELRITHYELILL